MHKLPNKSTILRYRFVALLICLKWLLFIASVSVIIYSFLTYDKELTRLGLKIAAIIVPLFLLRLVFASLCQCPLCRVPLFIGNNCSKHRNAHTLFGSHRLLVAIQVLFLSRFRCPYCNEPTQLKSRR